MTHDARTLRWKAESLPIGIRILGLGRWWVLSKRELYYPRRELLKFIEREAKKLTKGGKNDP